MIIKGIFEVRSKATGKVLFVGGGYNVRFDWAHLTELLRKNMHSDVKLQEHFAEYGQADLEFNIVEKFEQIGRNALNEKIVDYKESLKPKATIKFEPKVEVNDDMAIVVVEAEEEAPKKKTWSRKKKDDRESDSKPADSK